MPDPRPPDDVPDTDQSTTLRQSERLTQVLTYGVVTSALLVTNGTPGTVTGG